MEFARVVRSRRMTRAFAPNEVPRETLEYCVDLASRAPSAGKTQGWHLLALEGVDRDRFWNLTLPPERRASFVWPKLLSAPVLLLPFVDPAAYLARYSESDKNRTGLGSSTTAWSAPYWTIDGSFAVMTLLHALHDEGLGALFFGVFDNEQSVRAEFAVPERFQLLGAIAVGVREAEDSRAGRSASRPRRRPDQILNWGGFG